VLEDKQYGKHFSAIYAGTANASGAHLPMPTELVEPDASNVHFDVNKSAKLYQRLAKSNEGPPCCAYCDKTFATRAEVAKHVKAEQGQHYIEFTRLVLHKRDLLAAGDQEAIMQYLQHRCGVWNWAIYTQRTRREIRAMMHAVSIAK
jgi:hypothetical protein